MGVKGQGVAYRLWLEVERRRSDRGMTKYDLWLAMKDLAGEGPSPARSTIDNLRDSTRPPQPRIVRALAEVLGIPWQQAQELAGLIPPGTSPAIDVREAITRSEDYNDAEKRALLGLLDVLDAKHSDRPRGQESA